MDAALSSMGRGSSRYQWDEIRLRDPFFSNIGVFTIKYLKSQLYFIKNLLQ